MMSASKQKEVAPAPPPGNPQAAIPAGVTAERLAAMKERLLSNVGMVRVMFREEGRTPLAPDIDIVDVELAARLSIAPGSPDRAALRWLLEQAQPAAGHAVVDYNALVRSLRRHKSAKKAQQLQSVRHNAATSVMPARGAPPPGGAAAPAGAGGSSLALPALPGSTAARKAVGAKAKGSGPPSSDPYNRVWWTQYLAKFAQSSEAGENAHLFQTSRKAKAVLVHPDAQVELTWQQFSRAVEAMPQAPDGSNRMDQWLARRCFCAVVRTDAPSGGRTAPCGALAEMFTSRIPLLMENSYGSHGVSGAMKWEDPGFLAPTPRELGSSPRASPRKTTGPAPVVPMSNLFGGSFSQSQNPMNGLSGSGRGGSMPGGRQDSGVLTPRVKPTKVAAPVKVPQPPATARTTRSQQLRSLATTHQLQWHQECCVAPPTSSTPRKRKTGPTAPAVQAPVAAEAEGAWGADDMEVM